MKIGPRHYNGASCHIMAVDLPAHIARLSRQLTQLHVPIHKRHQGLATALMRNVCLEADREGMMLMLEAKPEPPHTPAEAESFYARFGFQTIQTSPIRLMARPCRDS